MHRQCPISLFHLDLFKCLQFFHSLIEAGYFDISESNQIEKERQRDRDRERERQTDRQTDRQRERERERERDREREREIDDERVVEGESSSLPGSSFFLFI